MPEEDQLLQARSPQVKEAVRMFRSRIINVLIGCAVGLLFLLVGGPNEWTLPLALAVTVLVSSSLIHIQTFWRQAPITAAIVIATGVTHHSRLVGIEFGLHKVGEGVGRRRARPDWRGRRACRPAASETL
jgi:uncharacterized membrane protein YgaE (UPF0421/DUF939 family)